MKFSISRDALIKPLNLVAGVVERRQTLPILSNVLLVLEGTTLSLTGTDLEVELVGRVELESAGVDGEVTVPARRRWSRRDAAVSRYRLCLQPISLPWRVEQVLWLCLWISLWSSTSLTALRSLWLSRMSVTT